MKRTRGGAAPPARVPPRRAATSAAVARLVVTGVVLAALAGCSAGPDPSSAGPVRAEAAGPPEITASAAGSPLPPGTPGQGTPPVVIGTKDFPEQFLLGELYAQALRAKGFTVTLAQNVGGTETIDAAFATDRIQMYPEYLGELASGPAHRPAGATPADTHRAATEFEHSQRGGTVLDQTPYQNIDVVVVRRDLADREHLRAVPDLARLSSSGDGARLAAQPPFRDRPNGLAGMREAYGLSDLGFLAVAPDETYGALDAGQVQAADGFSTDPQLRSPRYRALDDPRNIFGFQYVAPVVKQGTVDRSGPAFTQVCDWVSAQLTVDAIREMRQAQTGGADEAVVARDFLARRGLR